jgi:hypothetical protein
MRRHICSKIKFVAVQAVEQFLDDLAGHLASPFDRRRTEQRRKQPPLTAMLLALQRRRIAREEMVCGTFGCDPAHHQQFLEPDRKPLVAQELP